MTMDRRTIVIVALCLLVFVFYRPILDRLGLGRYLAPPRPAATGPAPGGTPPGGSARPDTGAVRAAAPSAAPATPATPDRGAARAPAPAAERAIHVETPLYHAVFSNLGARLVSVDLKRFASAYGASRAHGRPYRVRPGVDVPPGDRVVLAGGPTLQLDLGSGAGLRSLADRSYAVSESLDARGQVRALTFTTQDSAGTLVRQTYRIRPDRYAMDLEVEIRNPPAALPDYSLAVRSWPPFTEADRLSDQRAFRASCLVGTNIHRVHAHDLLKGPRNYDGNAAWAGVQSRYFLAAVAIVKGTSRGVVLGAEEHGLPVAAFPYVQRNERPVQEVATSRLVVSLPAPSEPVHRYVLFVGPSEYEELDRLTGTQLARSVDLGWNWVRPISALLLRVLNAIHGMLLNYGVAIIVLATLLRLLLHPLNMASMRSMRAMQKLQPELDRLRQKYKDDAQAMNTAVMALYRENKVNPAGGCVPMLAQMPILIALYQVLFNAIELRQAPFVGWMSDLSAPDQLMTIAGFPIRLLPILMTGSGLLLQRMTPTSPQQAPTAYMMNLIMLVFFYNLPSGLVLYWTVMNLLSALQQWLVLRQDQPAAAVVVAGPSAAASAGPSARASRRERR